MAEPIDTVKGNTTGRGAGYYVVQQDFNAVDKGKKPDGQLDYRTRVETGNMADRIVAKRKGFKLKGKPRSQYERKM